MPVRFAGNQSLVWAGVAGACVLAALPFLNKTVYQREQQVAQMRDAVMDAKDEARNSRLSTKRHT
jgi:hypothetical protein